MVRYKKIPKISNFGNLGRPNRSEYFRPVSTILPHNRSTENYWQLRVHWSARPRVITKIALTLRTYRNTSFITFKRGYMKFLQNRITNENFKISERGMWPQFLKNLNFVLNFKLKLKCSIQIFFEIDSNILKF